MKCPNCGYELTEHAKFCSNCGTKLNLDETQESERDAAPIDSTEPPPIDEPTDESMKADEKSKDEQIAEPIKPIPDDTRASFLTKVKNKFPKKTWIKILSTFAAAVIIIIVCAVVFHRPNPTDVVIPQGMVTVGLKESPSIDLKVSPANASSRSFQIISSDAKVAEFSIVRVKGKLVVKIKPSSIGSTNLMIRYKSQAGKTQTSNDSKIEIIDKDAQKKQADAVIKQIDLLGNVTLDDYDKVQKITSAYDKLPAYAKNLVKNHQKLEDAENSIQKEAEAKAAPVIQAISEIGEVTKTSGDKIQSVRALYDALPARAKQAVSNYNDLTSAEFSLQSIQADEQAAAQKAQDAKDFKNSCGSYSYKEIARSPDSYAGKNAKFTGEVIQVLDNGTDVELRVNVTKDEYGIWDDTILVSYTYPDTDSPKILEDDVITMYGTLAGNETYTSTLGASITIPALKAEYIDIK